MAGGGGRVLLAFIAGCLLAPWLPSLPGIVVLVALAALAGAGCAFRRTRLPAIFLFGALWFLAAAQWQMDRQWPAERAGQIQTVTGHVVGLPQRHEQSVRFVLAVDGPPGSDAVPARIRVSWYRPHRRVEPGSHWRMDLRLEPPTGRDNPGGFDYQRYLLARRIGATGRVRGQPWLLANEPGKRWLDRQRQRLSHIIQSETVD
ncbi:MAG TPA: ComEC/Rec2 family competence protein, partial [Wenzhouxiangella sp.]|nr:ComEC/Rec2 family competence protein [Wenzhouxiangella sp.]